MSKINVNDAMAMLYDLSMKYEDETQGKFDLWVVLCCGPDGVNVDLNLSEKNLQTGGMAFKGETTIAWADIESDESFRARLSVTVKVFIKQFDQFRAKSPTMFDKGGVNGARKPNVH